LRLGPIGFCALLAVLGLPSVSAFAQEPGPDEAIFVFAGRYTDAYFDRSFMPLSASYEDNFVLGAGYQKFFAEPLPDWHLGAEVGAAFRGGMDVSGELWAGAVARYDGFHLGENLRISPSFTFGLSAITNPIGKEARRAEQRRGDPSVLFFLAPEISFASLDHPDTELFVRLHHRSGAWGTLGGMGDGANAQVIGIRHRF
jgi:hypothetical protein